MPLVKNGKPVADPFVAVADDAPLPDAPALVSADRLLKEGAALFAHAYPVGVIWPNSKDVLQLEPFLARLAVVALVFPKFRDGRAYTQARLLRERLRYTGELRATGNVLRDQFLLMVRCGFDALDVAKDADAAAVEKELHTYSVFYQPTGDGRPVPLRARLAARNV
ncbi:DUF934 domain-containing protein [Azorhizobium doebereinerae]|uniref:DUF934 domain-containing protein n=1 Tax=Azorhizobium doebereinerae TaxID=281091 RepID=UPI000408E671|nr:DUF934 domain-containing protein [Azorhizobium doebereinerae]